MSNGTGNGTTNGTAHAPANRSNGADGATQGAALVAASGAAAAGPGTATLLQVDNLKKYFPITKGLFRKVIGEETVEEVLGVLGGDGTKMPKNWNRRFKHNRDKMKTGDIFELAEVVRNLAQRDQEKGLSTGEKQMFSKAKRILASELMYAKGMEEEEAREFLEEVLEEIGAARKARA